MIVHDTAFVPFAELQSSLLWFGIIVWGGSCIPTSAVRTPWVTCSNAIKGGANSCTASRAVSGAIAALLRVLSLALCWVSSQPCFERFLFIVMVLPVYSGLHLSVALACVSRILSGVGSVPAPGAILGTALILG